MATGFFSHETCQRHEMGAAHPESPARIAAIVDCLRASGVLAELTQRDAPVAQREDLLLAHPERHVESLHRQAPAEGLASVGGWWPWAACLGRAGSVSAIPTTWPSTQPATSGS